jgi:hypothetical protein
VGPLLLRKHLQVPQDDTRLLPMRPQGSITHAEPWGPKGLPQSFPRQKRTQAQP